MVHYWFGGSTMNPLGHIGVEVAEQYCAIDPDIVKLSLSQESRTPDETFAIGDLFSFLQIEQMQRFMKVRSKEKYHLITNNCACFVVAVLEKGGLNVKQYCPKINPTITPTHVIHSLLSIKLSLHGQMSSTSIESSFSKGAKTLIGKLDARLSKEALAARGQSDVSAGAMVGHVVGERIGFAVSGEYGASVGQIVGTILGSLIDKGSPDSLHCR